MYHLAVMNLSKTEQKTVQVHPVLIIQCDASQALLWSCFLQIKQHIVYSPKLNRKTVQVYPVLIIQCDAFQALL